MRRTDGALRTPFVLTFAAAAVAAAPSTCAPRSDSPVSDGGGPGHDAAADGSSGAAGLSGSGGSSGEAGDAEGLDGNVGDAGPVADCPSAPPTFEGEGWNDCAAARAPRCHYDVTCQSGVVPLDFRCAPGGWVLDGPPACVQPYDSCPGTSLHCVPTYGWTFEVSYDSNPPGPCPASRPSPGATCRPGGFGGDPDACGYACSGGVVAPWTVLRCEPGSAGAAGAGPDPSWTSDGACGAAR